MTLLFIKEMWIVPVVVVLALGLSCHEANAQPPTTGIWCDYVQLPAQLNFSFVQPVWWNEYFLYNAPENQTITFKIYPGIVSDEHLRAYVAENFCPVFTDWKAVSDFGTGTASVTIDAVGGNQYVLFTHMSGANYTILGCEGTSCPVVCPNDCTGLNGVCDLPSGNCTCRSPYVGDDCSKVPPVHHKKVPFGNIEVFYVVVAGVPTAVAIAIVTIVGAFIYNRKKKVQNKLDPHHQKQPLLSSEKTHVASHRPAS